MMNNDITDIDFLTSTQSEQVDNYIRPSQTPDYLIPYLRPRQTPDFLKPYVRPANCAPLSTGLEDHLLD